MRIHKPAPAPVMPEPPAWLLPVAADRWRELAPQLAEVLTALDLDALGKYCQCWAQYLASQKWMAENGMTMTVRNDKGEVKIISAVPHVGIAAKMMAEMKYYERQFGLTPAARASNLQDIAESYSDADLAKLAAHDPGTGRGRTRKTKAKTG
ncbi:MAG: phage terminase small subunit P27 family [Planctomycetota bacterium]